MRYILITTVILSCFICSGLCIALQLTDKQFKNIDIIQEELLKQFPSFKGFNGSKNDMQVYGIDEATAIQAINLIDVDTIINNNKIEYKRKIKKLIDKFKALGFDKEDFNTLRYLIKEGDSA